jgi:hypothetical protein
MLRTFKITALIKGKSDVVTGEITVLDIENVKRAFSKYGHLVLKYKIIPTNVKQFERLLPNYIREV